MAELTRLERLERDREALEAAIEQADAKSLPSLVREHRIVLAEVDKLAGPKEASTRDQLAARRAKRKAGAAGPPATEVR